MPFLMCVTSLRVCLWTPRRRLQHRIKLSRAFGCGVPACNPVLSRGEYWTRGTSRRCDEKSVHALVADGRRPSSRRIRFGFRLTRLRRVLRSMRELGWRETGSRLGLPRRASGPAASRVGPARTLTVVEPTAASETVAETGVFAVGTGFSHGCKISAPSVRDTLRPYRDRDPRPTPRRHVGLRTRARSLAARDGAPRVIDASISISRGTWLPSRARTSRDHALGK